MIIATFFPENLAEKVKNKLQAKEVEKVSITVICGEVKPNGIFCPLT